MNKATWKGHAAEVLELAGLTRFSPEAGVYLVTHAKDCPQCQARKKTRQRNADARARHNAYTSVGMIRVKGTQGGTYYE